ncbi:hypothetical protein LP420_04140 [Massilia sp. B-10]|nr:hypothetical protein LP420_04140 [Massilia sp. B-10]
MLPWRLACVEQWLEGYCVSAIILAGGDTIDHIIDPIDEVVEMIDALLSTMKLTYRPFVYVDLVSGWIWRLFRGYDFVANDLSLSSADARYVRHKLAELASLSQVDGIGVDLHKLGLCPYGSSFFLCRDSAELLTINGLQRPKPKSGLAICMPIISHSKIREPPLELQQSGRP